jgi:hypothetical protein
MPDSMPLLGIRFKILLYAIQKAARKQQEYQVHWKEDHAVVAPAHTAVMLCNQPLLLPQLYLPTPHPSRTRTILPFQLSSQPSSIGSSAVVASAVPLDIQGLDVL